VHRLNVPFGWIKLLPLEVQEMKSLLQRFFVIFTYCYLFVAAGCSGSPTSLVGTYSIENHGKINEFIRIEKQGDKYFLTEKQSGKWLSPLEVIPVSKAKLEEFLKETVKVEFSGIGNDNIALFQVPKGWKSGPFVCNTGFWLATMLDPIELHKN
jgi:hypothetical protein